MSTRFCSNCEEIFGDHYTEDCSKPIDWKRKAKVFEWAYLSQLEYSRKLETLIQTLPKCLSCKNRATQECDSHKYCDHCALAQKLELEEDPDFQEDWFDLPWAEVLRAIQ